MSTPVRFAVAAAAIGLLAVIGISVLPRGGDGIGTVVDASPSPAPSPTPTSAPGPSASAGTTLSLEPPADVDAYVQSAYNGLVDLPALTIAVVEKEGNKARYMYNGAGIVHHDHFGNATNSEPSEFRIFSRDVMAERSELDGEPIWLQNTGQGHPLRELSGGAGLQTYADRGYGWYSADGGDWSVIPDFPSNVSDIVGVADGFIARAESMWHSPDGMTWTEIGPYTEGSMLRWEDGVLVADSSGRVDLWTAAGAQPLPMQESLRTASGRSGAAVATGPLGLVSIGTSDVLYTPNGSDWRVEALPEDMYASGGGRQAPTITIGDDAVLVLMWSADDKPVATVWRGTPES